MAPPLGFFQKHFSRQRVGKYETEVRFGLLVIVISLLMLNFVSNTLLYRARNSRRDQLNYQMASAVRGLTRSIPQGVPEGISEQKRIQLQNEYQLSGLSIISSAPSDESIEGRKLWFRTAVVGMTPSQATDIGRALFVGDLNCITKGEGDTYSYVAAAKIKKRNYLFILSGKYPDLAYLDNAQETLFYVGLVGLFCIGLVYVLLSRFIMAPFKKLRKQALKAGRLDEDVTDDAEELVDEYRRMITDLEQSKEQLVELNEQIQQRADSLEGFNRQLISSMSSGLISLDKNGKVNSINVAGEEILRITASEAIGMTYAELFRDIASITSSITSCIETGIDVDYFEASCNSCSSRTTWLGLSISTVRNANHDVLGFSVFLNDLSELTHLRQELEKKQRLAALGEMSGGLAHQLRNSLGAISGYIKLIHKRMQKNNADDKSMPALVQEVREADDLVGRFLQFARPLQLEATACDLQRLISDVLENIQIRTEFEHIFFELHGQIEQTVEVDSLLLKQAITNIVENSALSYNNNSGVVKLILSLSASDVCLSVQDHGCGIPEEDQQRIFTPFFSSRPSGSGLGLPLADKIVQLHNGELTVESTVGEGTCFTMSLPLSQTSGCDKCDSVPTTVPSQPVV